MDNRNVQVSWSETHTPGFTTFYIHIPKESIAEQLCFPIKLGASQTIEEGMFMGHPRYELRRNGRLLKVLDHDEVVEFSKYAL